MRSHSRGALALLPLLASALIVTGATPAIADIQIASSAPAVNRPIALSGASAKAAPTIRAVANAPRTITVTARPGTGVMLSNGRSIPVFARASAAGRAVFTQLTPGTTYLIEARNTGTSRARVSVTALAAMSAPVRLTASTTASRTSIALVWKHTPTRATGGNAIGFRVVATPADPSIATITTDVRNVRSTVLTGLSSQTRYSFTLTPRNAAGYGRSTVARMNRTLDEIHGGAPGSAPGSASAQVPAADAIAEPIKGPITPTITQVSAPVAAAPAPGPAAPPPPPAPPATRTIYVCPDGYTETGDICTHVMAYTFHAETETTPYTYYTDSRYESCSGGDCPGSVFQDFGTDWSGTTCPRGGTMHSGQCLGWTTGHKWVNYQVKNAPPLGWHDDGSAFARQIQVRDAMPAGYSDDGTNWIKAASKIARIVPA